MRAPPHKLFRPAGRPSTRSCRGLSRYELQRVTRRDHRRKGGACTMRNRRIHEHSYPPAEYTRFDGGPLPARRLVEIWSGLHEEERLSFILSLDEAIADKVIELCELP